MCCSASGYVALLLQDNEAQLLGRVSLLSKQNAALQEQVTIRDKDLAALQQQMVGKEEELNGAVAALEQVCSLPPLLGNQQPSRAAHLAMFGTIHPASRRGWSTGNQPVCVFLACGSV